MANFVTARKYSPRAALPFFPLAALSLLIGLALVPDTLAQATSATVAATPPMGWNSWNKFGCNVSDKLIREIADAVVSSGMKDAGYQFVNIDDCWQVSRAADGTIVVDPERFPNGMKPLADYVKIDWCYAEGLEPDVQYPKFRDAIAQSGRPIVFSICNWGVKAPWTWGPHTGNLWRTTGDISDKYSSMSLIGFSQDGLGKFAGPGHWNDPDMLEVGNGGMKHDEYLTHMALWAILAAPLLAGNDIRSMSEETKAILMNPEVIAVDQDARGVQGHRAWDEGPLEIWVKPLADGSQAVGLFNRGESALKMTLDLNKIGAPASARLRDLWQRKDLGTVQNSYTAEVPKHGVVLLRVSK